MKTLDQWPIFKNSEWQLPFYHTYIQLKEGTDVMAFEEKSIAILEKFRATSGGVESKELFILQPLNDIHLDSHLTFELGENGDRQAINFLMFIAALILIIVYLNFINLTTALSSLKGKEVGIRKVMGSHKLQIIPRFLLESFVINMVSLLVAVGAVILTLDTLAKLIDIHFKVVE